MKRLLVLRALSCATLFLPVAFGQDPAKNIQLTRQAILAKRQEIVTQAMSFTPEEEKAFWPLYRDWRAKVAGIGDQQVELVKQIDTEYRTLDDAAAKKLIDTWMKLEQDLFKTRQAYLKRFRKVLPEKKVARFFQLENKMDSIVHYDLVGMVPLIE